MTRGSADRVTVEVCVDYLPQSSRPADAHAQHHGMLELLPGATPWRDRATHACPGLSFGEARHDVSATVERADNRTTARSGLDDFTPESLDNSISPRSFSAAVGVRAASDLDGDQSGPPAPRSWFPFPVMRLPRKTTSRNAITVQGPFSRHQWGRSLGGPLLRTGCSSSALRSVHEDTSIPLPTGSSTSCELLVAHGRREVAVRLCMRTSLRPFHTPEHVLAQDEPALNNITRYGPARGQVALMGSPLPRDMICVSRNTSISISGAPWPSKRLVLGVRGLTQIPAHDLTTPERLRLAVPGQHFREPSRRELLFPPRLAFPSFTPWRRRWFSRQIQTSSPSGRCVAAHLYPRTEVRGNTTTPRMGP